MVSLCQGLARASASKFRRIMSAVGTTPLQSPGWNEGKARNETLGKQRAQKIKSSVGAALQREHLPYVS